MNKNSVEQIGPHERAMSRSPVADDQYEDPRPAFVTLSQVTIGPYFEDYNPYLNPVTYEEAAAQTPEARRLLFGLGIGGVLARGPAGGLRNASQANTPQANTPQANTPQANVPQENAPQANATVQLDSSSLAPLALRSPLVDDAQILGSGHDGVGPAGDRQEPMEEREESNPLVEEDGKEPEYEVERLVSRRMTRGEKQYMVKWRGWDDTHNLWYFRDDLPNAQELINEYEAQRLTHDNLGTDSRIGQTIEDEQEVMDDPGRRLPAIDFSKPLLSNEVFAILTSQTYDPSWIQNSGLDPSIITNQQTSKQKLHEFFAAVFNIGDVFSMLDDSGIAVPGMTAVVHSLGPAMLAIGPTRLGDSPLLVNVANQSLGDLEANMILEAGDSDHTAVRRVPYASVEISRAGQSLGNLHNIRQAYNLYQDQVELWAVTTEQYDLVPMPRRQQAPSNSNMVYVDRILMCPGANGTLVAVENQLMFWKPVRNLGAE